ncbi:alanine racemase, partial [Rhodopseudomonas sp. BR0C11]|nr:alanine racemase [Rhodopseudomonas sp. BR0C11]
MHILPDPNATVAELLTPEAGKAAEFAAANAAATGILTVDLDALVANWRKLEKTAIPSECAGVVKG